MLCYVTPATLVASPQPYALCVESINRPMKVNFCELFWYALLPLYRSHPEINRESTRSDAADRRLADRSSNQHGQYVQYVRAARSDVTEQYQLIGLSS